MIGSSRGDMMEALDKGAVECLNASGRFDVVCRRSDGTVRWRGVIDNVVTKVGKNLALDTYLAEAVGYTVTGPFIGLISSVDYTTGSSIEDTMTSHGGWKEAGATNAPTYSGTRKTCAWAAASNGSKALSLALVFAITGAGTVKGCFLVYGTGAVNTIDNTSGTLYSAGVFAGGDKLVGLGDGVSVSYTATL
jgi:hypothetical protein